MDINSILEIIKLGLTAAIIPMTLFARQVTQELKALKEGQIAIKESNSKEHKQVCDKLDELGRKVEAGEKDNRMDHQALRKELTDLDKQNSIEHTRLSHGEKL